MAHGAIVDSEPRFLFTAPWEPVVVRRGDALGLRALADQFADAIAPDMSNRIRDGRWVTILSWCLARSHEVFHASGGRSVATRAEQSERYAWLRPLELMWVARTIALASEDWRNRSLAGQRRVRPWYEYDHQSTDRFGMSVDQFRAYRQTGMYGGYRLAFRKWPGMTVRGDGWTPGPATIKLAKWLDGKLGSARPSWPLHAGDSEEESLPKRSAKLSRGDEGRWWLRQWTTFDHSTKTADANTLPRRKDDFALLPEVEHLKSLVFLDETKEKPSQNGTRRRMVSQVVAKSTAANHIELCIHLGQVFDSDHVIKLLPHFSRLADAGLAAMDHIVKSLHNKSRGKLLDVAARPAASPITEELMLAAQEWRKDASMQIRHIETAHRFASAIQSAQPVECLRALLQHHEVFGGLRWFVLRNGWIEPRTPPRSGSSRYRFRLWSLCRLATQCGVLRDMPRVLLEDEADDDDNTSGVNDE